MYHDGQEPDDGGRVIGVLVVALAWPGPRPRPEPQQPLSKRRLFVGPIPKSGRKTLAPLHGNAAGNARGNARPSLKTWLEPEPVETFADPGGWSLQTVPGTI
eukprot:6506911-Prymnesium_polylepis.1